MSDQAGPEGPEETTEFFALMGELPRGDYSNMQRYQDFNTVFMGSQEGRRVLRELMYWARMFRRAIIPRPMDPLRLALDEGRRDVVAGILTTINHEPEHRPSKADTGKDQS